MIDLSHFCLDDARALLQHDPSLELPKPEASPTAYLQSVIDHLCKLSLKDPLTGLANRRHFQNVMRREIDVATRSGEPALLLMLDIDHFKKINDTYGHQAGDMVIQAIGRCLSGCVRPMDTVARYGGEEFAIILPSCHGSLGETVAERIREAVENLCITLGPQSSVKVTISIGGAYTPEWVRSTKAIWTERADLQLYRAKAQGRNCVFVDQPPMMAVSAEEKNMLFGHLPISAPVWIESDTSDASNDASGSTKNRLN